MITGSSASVCFAVAMLISICGAWDYEHVDQWATLRNSAGNLLYPTCASGTQQSPVALSQVANDATLQPLRPAWPDSLQYNVLNNGHTIQFTPRDNANVQSFVDPNTGAAYALKQFHFHSPSEHAWGGSLLDAEVHMVHQKISGPPEANALLVVGVGFSAIPLGNDTFFDAFWGPLTNASVNSSTDYFSRLNFKAALPLSEAYVTYPGSLTTPPCTEGVQWYVMSEPQTLSNAQLQGLLRSLALPTNPVGGNRRPLQPLNGRIVRGFGGVIASSSTPTLIGLGIACVVLIGIAVLILIVVLIRVFTNNNRAEPVKAVNA